VKKPKSKKEIEEEQDTGNTKEDGTTKKKKIELMKRRAMLAMARK